MSKNNKYSKETKLKAVREYLDEGSSYITIMKEYGIPSDLSIRLWIAQYKEYGEEAFEDDEKNNGKRKKYDGDFKVSVVEYMHETGASQVETGMHFKVFSPNIIAGWDKIYREEGADALRKEKKRGRPRKMEQDLRSETGVNETESDDTEKKEKAPWWGTSLDKPFKLDLDETAPEGETKDECIKRQQMEIDLLKKLLASVPEEDITKGTAMMAIEELRQEKGYPKSRMMRMAKMRSSTHYKRRKILEKPDKYADTVEAMKASEKANDGLLGYRRLQIDLDNKGIHLNPKTVLRLMRLHDMTCKVGKAEKYSSYKGDCGTVKEDLVKRDFTAPAPGLKLTTDVTMIVIRGKRYYLSILVDMYNGEIVAYVLSEHPDMEQVLMTLDGAFDKFPDLEGAILHSDQGWVYQNPEYQKILADKGIRQSMSRKGNCLDNAFCESGISKIKVEYYYKHKKEFKSIKDFEEGLKKFITYYNEVRIKTRLRMSPVQYRLKNFPNS